MATTATYPYRYFLGGSSDTPDTLFATYTFGPDSGDTTLTDDHDGTDDGDVVVGDPLSWSRDTTGSGAKVTTLYGFAANGDPVIEVHNTTFDTWNYYQLSHDPNLQGEPITVTQTGTYTMCFTAGTGIATPQGEVAVETLAIGDPILTASGATVPVKWIGRQTVKRLFSGPKTKLVRIRAGALGDGLPQNDLTVTGDHGMILDGHVINASALVNGGDIDWVAFSDLPEQFTVYHVETEDHDVILANGAPAETFIDYPGRRAFDNFGEYLDLYGCERIIPEMPLPRVSSARHLPVGLARRLGIVRTGPAALSA